MREGGIFDPETVGKVAMPFLVLSVGRGESAAGESFVRRVERVHNITGDLAEPAQVLQEQGWASRLLGARDAGEVRVFVRPPELLVGSSGRNGPGDVRRTSRQL